MLFRSVQKCALFSIKSLQSHLDHAMTLHACQASRCLRVRKLMHPTGHMPHCHAIVTATSCTPLNLQPETTIQFTCSNAPDVDGLQSEERAQCSAQCACARDLEFSCRRHVADNDRMQLGRRKTCHIPESTACLATPGWMSQTTVCCSILANAAVCNAGQLKLQTWRCIFLHCSGCQSENPSIAPVTIISPCSLLCGLHTNHAHRLLSHVPPCGK